MAEEGEISPVREDISPDPTHSLEEDEKMPSERRGRKRTPSPTRSKGKIPAKRRRKHFDCRASSSGSLSSNNSDSDSVSNSDKSPVRIRKSQRPEKSTSTNTNSTRSKSPPLALIDFDTSADIEEGVYTRFNAAGENIPRLCLTKDMTKYLQKQFSSYLRDKVLKEMVLQANPVPDVDCLATPEIDDYLGELFDSLGRSYGRSADSGLSRVQTRICNIMGPLGSLWLTLEEVRTGKSDANVDLFECLKLVEQSITLIGQAKVSLTYERRLAILYRLTGDVKKAKKLLSKHESSLLDSHKALFGNKFYKALRKATKLRQASKEISNHIGASRSKQQGSSSNRSRGTSKAVSSGKDYQPFRKTPPSQQRGRGGGRSVSFRGKTNRYPKGKSIVIKFTKTTGSPESKLHRNRTLSTSKHVHCTKSGSRVQSDCPKRDPSCCFKSSYGYIHFKTIPPFRGKAKTFPEQLEVINTGSIHSTSCNWGSDTIRKSPDTENCSISSISQPTGDGTNSGGDTIYVRKSCGSGGPSTKQRVYKLSVSGSQKGWGEQTRCKSQESQLFYNLSTFQNGRVTPFKTGSSEGRSYDKDRFERCLLLRAYTPKTSPFLEIYVGGETLSVQLPPFWSSTSTVSLHQIVEASGSPVAQTGFKADYLPGRYNSFQSNFRRVFARQGHHTMAPSTLGICDKLEKICANPSPNNGIPGVSDQLLGNEIIVTGGESAESDSILPTTASTQGFISERNSQDSGEIDVLYPGNSSCPLTLQTSANAADKESVSWPVLRDRGDSEPELQGGPSVVVRSNHQLEWSCYKYPPPPT